MQILEIHCGKICFSICADIYRVITKHDIDERAQRVPTLNYLEQYLIGEQNVILLILLSYFYFEITLYNKTL